MKKINFTSKTNGSFTVIVDDIDYIRMKNLKTMKWSVVKKRNNLIYFQKRLPGNKLVELHRWIMQPEDGKYVDHINKNTLDNRRQNLRICTNSANLRNSHLNFNNKSGHNGIYFDKSRNKWLAQIKVNYKQIFLGRFKDKNRAILARKKAEKKYWDF